MGMSPAPPSGEGGSRSLTTGLGGLHAQVLGQVVPKGEGKALGGPGAARGQEHMQGSSLRRGEAAGALRDQGCLLTRGCHGRSLPWGDRAGAGTELQKEGGHTKTHRPPRVTVWQSEEAAHSPFGFPSWVPTGHNPRYPGEASDGAPGPRHPGEAWVELPASDTHRGGPGGASGFNLVQPWLLQPLGD